MSSVSAMKRAIKYAVCPHCEGKIEVNALMDGTVCILCGSSFATKDAIAAFEEKYGDDIVAATEQMVGDVQDPETHLVDRTLDIAEKGMDRRHQRAMVKEQGKIEKLRVASDTSLRSQELDIQKGRSETDDKVRMAAIELEKMKLQEEIDKRKAEDDRKDMPLLFGCLLFILLFFGIIAFMVIKTQN